VVRRNGKYFLLDWKTNYLSGYTPNDVAAPVAECDYVRQYRLYLQALERWLCRVRGRTFDFQREFGGVYYLFLRGLNGVDDSAGVYFHRAEAQDLNLQAVLS